MTMVMTTNQTLQPSTKTVQSNSSLTKLDLTNKINNTTHLIFPNSLFLPMNYGPTNPRSFTDIRNHSWWKSNPTNQSYLTNAINRPNKKICRFNKTTEAMFYPGDSHSIQKASGGTLKSLTGTAGLSSYDIYQDPTILPYYIDPKTIQTLASQPKYALQYQNFQKALTKYQNARRGRIPTLYRITDFTYCDDMGRIFSRAPHPRQRGCRARYKDSQQRLVFQQYQLDSGSDFRNATWFDGPMGAVSMAAYIGIGYAGYAPSVQTQMYTSLQFDVHHIAENKFDVTPTTVIPLPTWMHLRWVHGSTYNNTQNTLFSRSKAPLIYE
uniref:Cap2 n=1 Tax=CRESS DNA virus TaxID=3138951 RepID=A0AAU8H8I5_9VIRU